MRAILEIESTKAKAAFASLPAKAQTGDVAITRHGKVRAYLLSPERYAYLSAIDHVGGDVVRKLDEEFDALVVRMQSGAHARAVDRIASASLATILTAPAKSTQKPRKRKHSA